MTLAITGLLNFGVSFALAFRTALRARNLDAVTRARLRTALFSELLRRPWTFAVPPERGGLADTLEAESSPPDTPSDDPTDQPLPDEVAAGKEPLIVLGAMSGG